MAQIEKLFHTQLLKLLDKSVSLNVGNAFAIKGKLAHVKSDYIVVDTSSSTELVIPLDHIRCIGLESE